MARRIHANRRHIRQFFEREGIVPVIRPQTLSNNPKWHGGRIRDKHGYILVRIPEHPYATRHGYVREHRLLMERMLGRYLLPTEVVDHIDGNPANNRPHNLRLFASNADHLRATLAGRTPNWTEEGKARLQESFDRGLRLWRKPSPETSASDVDPSPHTPDHPQA
jgi:hypothetical protein